MNRQWGQAGVRVASVGLLVVGVIGGVYLGRDQADRERSAASQMSIQADAAELQMLKARENEHAAARSWQREAEGDAAAQAAAAAKTAASKARDLEKKVIAKKAAAKKAKEAASDALVPFAGEIPASCNEYSGNRATGCALMLSSGFKIDQFPCLNSLWNKESGWNAKAANPSGAYGIPQALPGSKMASAGADWKNNPATQIKWGLGYIKGRYGDPCSAWSTSENTGSY